MTFLDKVKQRVWRFIYRFFPTYQQLFLKWGVIWHEKGRQRYHVGWLSAGQKLEDLKRYLNANWGFGNHFIAWHDEGQVLSWRKLVSFKEQYHVRVFEDGEIRGHFEFTPEAHPIKHFREIGERECTKELINFLGDFVTEKKHISHLQMDPHAYDPDSQITVENQAIYKTLFQF